MRQIAHMAALIEVAPAWAGMPVGFALLTHADRQFVAFYDGKRRMTLAERRLDSAAWRFVLLPQTLGWDSHNSVTLVVDELGFLHLSGNMHGDPLVYFRTTQPWDITTFVRVGYMLGSEEDCVTYPVFLRGPRGELIFTYRNGSSGNGNQIYNVYDSASRRWRRLLDTDLTDGEGRRNAYLSGPQWGPDGVYHLAWVWRETPDCATNHDLSYARSRNLIQWENSRGEPIPLPITLARGEIVDPVPPGGGLINGNVKIGFDHLKHPILSYQKHDSSGNTQVFNARLVEGRWQIARAGDWQYRWEFQGRGTIHFEINVMPVCLTADGELRQSYSHDKYGAGIWTLDPVTLRLVLDTPAADVPAEVALRVSERPGMQGNVLEDSGVGGEPGTRYVLFWESLPENRDHVPQGPIPAPSALRVLKLSDHPVSASVSAN